jgi:hypothetical protein
MPKTVEFKVAFPLPDRITVADAREYVEDAVLSWRDTLRPPRAYGPDDDGDPMWWLDRDSVKVTRLRRLKQPATE